MLKSHKSVASEPMGVILEPMLQPSKCAAIKYCFMLDSMPFSAKSPSITIGKLFITPEPSPLPNAQANKEAKLAESINTMPFFNASSTPAFAKPNTTINSPKLNITMLKGAFFKMLTLAARFFRQKIKAQIAINPTNTHKGTLNLWQIIEPSGKDKSKIKQ